MKAKKKSKPERLICGGCADDIASDDTAGRGGCSACGDGIPKCSECHEEHCAYCEPGEE